MSVIAYKSTIAYECHHTCVIMAVDYNQILENTLKQQN